MRRTVGDRDIFTPGMGWFTRKRPHALPPDELREALFQAVHMDDAGRLRELVDGHRDSIREHFPVWRKVPESVRTDPERVNAYGAGLIGVAQHCAQHGDPSLIELLTGPAADNPVLRWQEAIVAAQEAMEAGQYAEAEAPLRDSLAAGRGLSGSGVDHYQPITLGLLGQCRFHQGDAAEAVALFGEALAICRRTADLEGEIAYLNSLHEAHRWLGNDKQAIDLARQLAEHCERAGDHARSDWARGRAARMAAGEPLVRVVVEIDGQTVELDELPAEPPAGRVQFQFERNRLSLGGVTALVDEGSRLGSAGDSERALAAFQAAARLDPSDPQPPYLAGLALLELGRYAEAVQSYDTTERLAPGWFHCRADRWLAAELAAGRVSTEAFQALRQIEDGGAPPDDKARLAAAAIAITPELPALYLLRAEALIKVGAAAAAEVVARAGLQRDPDADVRTRLLVTLAQVAAPAERRALLEQAVALDGNRTSAAMARLMLKVATAATARR
jgi:tetratricopeptide (TPR) repeat protein